MPPLSIQEIEDIKKRIDNTGTITDAIAEILAKQQRFSPLNRPKYKGFMNKIASINDNQAESLTEISELYLDGLKSITDEQAAILTPDYDGLLIRSLNGLTSITDAQAESLSKGRILSLDGLPSITDQQAEKFGNSSKYLTLNGLTAITDEQAQFLSMMMGTTLDISLNCQLLIHKHKKQ